MDGAKKGLVDSLMVGFDMFFYGGFETHPRREVEKGAPKFLRLIPALEELHCTLQGQGQGGEEVPELAAKKTWAP